MTGGSAPYRKGARVEREIKAAYEAGGWFVVRSPQSGSAIDLLCVKKVASTGISPWRTVVHFVQVKSRGYLRPAEKQAVVELAHSQGGLGILAWPEGKSVRRRDLRTGKELHELQRPSRTRSG
jgi:Holliday junction resolvase